MTMTLQCKATEECKFTEEQLMQGLNQYTHVTIRKLLENWTQSDIKITVTSSKNSNTIITKLSYHQS